MGNRKKGKASKGTVSAPQPAHAEERRTLRETLSRLLSDARVADVHLVQPLLSWDEMECMIACLDGTECQPLGALREAAGEASKKVDNYPGRDTPGKRISRALAESRARREGVALRLHEAEGALSSAQAAFLEVHDWHRAHGVGYWTKDGVTVAQDHAVQVTRWMEELRARKQARTEKAR